MASVGFLGRSSGLAGMGSGASVQTAPPAASSASSGQQGAWGEFSSGVGDVTQGRVSLLMLDSLILLLVLFYIWTHRAQGGG